MHSSEAPLFSVLPFAVYAPASDGNDPGGYARFLAKELAVSAATPVDKLIDA